MARGRSTLDWLVLEHEDDEFPALPDAVPPPRSRSRTAAICAGCLLLTGLVIVGSALIGAAGEGLATIDRELHSAIALEAWTSAPKRVTARTDADPTQRAGAVADLRDVIPETEIVDVNFDGGLAVAEVLESRAYPDGRSAARRMLRFYRYDGQEWVPAAADDSFLGAPLTLETERFIFKYRKRDRTIVEAAAPAMDAAYAAMRATIGLPPPAAKLTVAVDTSTSRAARPTLIADELHMPSPALLPVPVDLSGEQLFVWQALPLLAARTLGEAEMVQPVYSEWDYMVRVVYQWLMLERNDLQMAWRADVLEWRRGVYSPDAANSADYAASLSDLCRTHRVWERALWFQGSGVVALCLSPEPLQNTRLLGGDDLVSMWQTQAQPSYPYGGSYIDPVDPILATTLLDYAISAHGRDAVARLWQGFHDYRTWEELIPAVLGVSAEEFERGWQEHQLRRDHRPLQGL